MLQTVMAETTTTIIKLLNNYNNNNNYNNYNKRKWMAFHWVETRRVFLLWNWHKIRQFTKEEQWVEYQENRVAAISKCFCQRKDLNVTREASKSILSTKNILIFYTGYTFLLDNVMKSWKIFFNATMDNIYKSIYK